MPEAIVAALLIGLALKGKVGRLADANVRHLWIIYVVAILYIGTGVIEYSTGHIWHGWSATFVRVMWISGTMVFAIINRRIPGAKLVVLGLVFNMIAMVSNGGAMPVSKSAIASTWSTQYLNVITKEKTYVCHSFMDAGTRFPLLCDRIAAKRPPFFVKSVYSIGDLIMTLGAMIAIIILMRTPAPLAKKAVEEA